VAASSPYRRRSLQVAQPSSPSYLHNSKNNHKVRKDDDDDGHGNNNKNNCIGGIDCRISISMSTSFHRTMVSNVTSVPTTTTTGAEAAMTLMLLMLLLMLLLPVVVVLDRMRSLLVSSLMMNRSKISHVTMRIGRVL
jgi:hypothetical protein